MQEKASGTSPRSGRPAGGLAYRAIPVLRLLPAILACLPLLAEAQLSLPRSAGATGGEAAASSTMPGQAGQTGFRLPGARSAPALRQPAAAAAGQPGRDGLVPVDRIVAVVNQGVITENELAGQIRLIEQRSSASGAVLPPQAELRRQVLEQMILQLAQLQFAADYGMKPSDAEIDRAVSDVAQGNGLSSGQLRQRLEADGVSFDGFRHQLEAEIVALRLRERETANSVSISEAEVDAELARSGRVSAPEFEVQQILLKVPEGADQATIERQRRLADSLAARARQGEDFAQLAARHSESADAASGGSLGWRPANRLPGLFADSVAGLQAGEIAPVLRSPAGFHILRLADRREGKVLAVELSHARHILLPATSPAEEAEAIRRLEEFRRDIESGQADFAALARAHSRDGSAAQGGDLGWLHPGQTVPEFEQAMQALADGEVSAPVRSAFGVHLIQVLARRSEAVSSEQLRNEARQKLRAAKGSEAYEQWLRELRDRTYVEYRKDES